MSLCKRGFLFKKEYAVLGQPVSLFVIVIVATTILLLWSLSTKNLMRDTQLHQIEQQVNTILFEATHMFEYAADGSGVTIHAEFPPSMRYIVFGSLPRNQTLLPESLVYDEKASNNYFFVLDDGSLHTYHSNVRFSNHNMTGCAIFSAGKYTITLQLCQKKGITHVAMS